MDILLIILDNKNSLFYSIFFCNYLFSYFLCNYFVQVEFTVIYTYLEKILFYDVPFSSLENISYA